MDPEKLREYVAGYDSRRQARLAERRAQADRARALAPELADLCRQYGARTVRLFGSLVTGRYGSTPDVDLAIEELPPDRFFDLLAALQIRAAPIEVDLVDIRTASPELRRAIEKEGQFL